MTNKEAAEFIWDVLDGVKSFNEEGGRGLEALDLAIKALKNEKAKESEIIKAYTKGFDTGVETVKNERPKVDIRWTDKLAVTSSGDIIDFEGRVVGHINLEDIIGGAE